MADDEFMFSATVTMSEFRLALSDETTIEKMIFDAKARQKRRPAKFGKLERRDLESLVAAIKRLDVLVVDGTYFEVRDVLRHKVAASLPKLPELCPRAEKHARLVENFFDGLKSPDPDQRERFRAVSDRWVNEGKSVPEVIEELSLFETAKRKKGRPTLPVPWANETAAMEKIRLLVARGATVALAARSVADDESRADSAERAKTFARLYAAKARLRELNEDDFLPDDMTPDL